MTPVLKKSARSIVESFGAVFIALLRLLRPFRHLKFGLIHAERIGHLTQNTEVFLRRLQLGLLPPIGSLILVAPSPSAQCNRQLLTMYKRHLPILESDTLAKILRIWAPRLKRTPFFEPLPTTHNEYEEWGRGRATLAFTTAEEERGKAALARMGLRENDWFVCFHSRDAAFLANEKPGNDWSYHNYRDCDVGNFLKAARYVADQGGYALRMGAAVDKPLPAGLHPRIIDYATLHRDEFLDIYLAAKCRFMIASDSGLFGVSNAFDVPVVNTNVPRIGWASFRPQDIFIHKQLFDEARGRLFTFPEILSLGHDFLTQSSYLAKHRLRLIENTADDILDATREMKERLDGTFQESEEDREHQRRYKALFPPTAVCHAHQSRIGRDFLRKHAEIVFGEPAAKGRAG